MGFVWVLGFNKLRVHRRNWILQDVYAPICSKPLSSRVVDSTWGKSRGFRVIGFKAVAYI